jgi:hypothetical protein
MFKKSIVFSLILILLFVSLASAQTYGIKVYVDGRKVSFPDQQPFIDENDRTLVPIRFIAEEMGATVEWHADNRMVIIEYDKGQTEKSTIDKIKDFFSLQNLNSIITICGYQLLVKKVSTSKNGRKNKRFWVSGLPLPLQVNQRGINALQ